MKRIISTLALALSLPAFALYAPNWERPIEEAQMDVVKADGFFADAENVVLTLNRRDGKKAPATSFTLELSLPSVGELRSVSYQIPVDEILASDKGNLIIRGELSLFNAEVATAQNSKIEIELVRPYAETGRNALDAEWTAVIRFMHSEAVDTTSTLYLSGEPESVLTIQERPTLE